jgi:hypothetical protein
MAMKQSDQGLEPVGSGLVPELTILEGRLKIAANVVSTTKLQPEGVKEDLNDSKGIFGSE